MFNAVMIYFAISAAIAGTAMGENKESFCASVISVIIGLAWLPCLVYFTFRWLRQQIRLKSIAS